MSDNKLSGSPPRRASLAAAMLPGRKASVNDKSKSASTSKLSGGSSASSSIILSTTPDDVYYSMNSNDYLIGAPIGFGSSAIVHIAQYIPLSKNVAIKMIDLDMFERNQIDELRREIQIMSLSKHPNLLPVHGSFVNESKLYIVTPFLSAGSCLDIMKTAFPEGFEEHAIATILKQSLQGLEYLHKNGLIHRDVKAGNLLVDDDGLVQLADFGVSSSLTETGERKGNRKTFVGTPCWMAPEVMEQSGYDYKADIWSFGITALELAIGHAPYAKYPPMKVLLLTLQNDPPTLDREKTKNRYSKSFKEMIDSCLQKDPSKRPTTEKLLQHSFFKQAKKYNYLVQSILQNLSPIQNRAHNKKNMPQIVKARPQSGDSWDFSDEVSTEKKKSVRFDFIPTEEFPDGVKPKPPLPLPISERTGSTSSANTVSSINSSNLTKKPSRFLFETRGSSNASVLTTQETQQTPQPPTTTQPSSQPSTITNQIVQSSATANITTNVTQSPISTPTTSGQVVSLATTGITPVVAALGAEVKRGRFTVNEGSQSSQNSTTAGANAGQGGPATLVANLSNTSLVNLHQQQLQLQQPPPPLVQSTTQHSISSIQVLSPSPVVASNIISTDKRGRFEVTPREIPTKDTTPTVEGNINAQPSSSNSGSPPPSLPRSRFTKQTPPTSADSVDSRSAVTMLFCDHIEMLVKQNEAQRAMLNEVITSLEKQGVIFGGGGTVIPDALLVDDPVSENSDGGGDGASLVGCVRQTDLLLAATIGEVGVLRRENEGLRRDVDFLMGVKVDGGVVEKDI